jgi:hypothetical protein
VLPLLWCFCYFSHRVGKNSLTEIPLNLDGILSPSHCVLAAILSQMLSSPERIALGFQELNRVELCITCAYSWGFSNDRLESWYHLHFTILCKTRFKLDNLKLHICLPFFYALVCFSHSWQIPLKESTPSPAMNPYLRLCFQETRLKTSFFLCFFFFFCCFRCIHI